jgi:hypothetical protein
VQKFVGALEQAQLQAAALSCVAVSIELDDLKKKLSEK